MENKNKFPLEYALYIPNNIDLDNLLSKYPTGLANEKAYLTFILHLIKPQCTIYNKMEVFTPMKSKFLENIVDNYRRFLNWLVERDILIANENYAIGVKCKSYKLNSPYYVKLKCEKIKLKTLIKKIIKLETLEMKNINEKSKKDFTLSISTQSLQEMPISCHYGYFSYPFWYGKRHIANLLNLKPKAMCKQLVEMGVLPDDRVKFFPYAHGAMYYSERIKAKNGYSCITFKINGDIIDIIRKIAFKNPEKFPLKYLPKRKRKQMK